MAFENLKKLLSTLADTVHSYGGVINKTLGDGLLCFFGYNFDSDQASPDHAEQALKCAIYIQQENLRRNLEAAEHGEPVYPLRIGINTASVYLGNVGSAERIDFTVVGNGVNFAKRLEGACEIHSVLFGATTRDLVVGVDLTSGAVKKRLVQIKHHSELVEAHEYDPFHDTRELRQRALDAFRRSANIERLNQRWSVHDVDRIKLSTDFGVGELLNFSRKGLSLRLGTLLAKHTAISIMVSSADGRLGETMAALGFREVKAEIRWSYADGAGYTHGVMLVGFNENQYDEFVQALTLYLSTPDDEAPASLQEVS